MIDTYVISCPVATDKLISKHCFRLQLVIHGMLASRILFRLRSSDDRVQMLSEDIHFEQPFANMRTTGTRSEVYGIMESKQLTAYIYRNNLT
jgi:hypothetical protein